MRTQDVIPEDLCIRWPTRPATPDSITSEEDRNLEAFGSIYPPERFANLQPSTTSREGQGEDEEHGLSDDDVWSADEL